MFKGAFVFFLSYWGVVVLDYVVFIGLSSNLPEKQMAGWMENPVIAILLLFWFFIGMPYFAASQVVKRIHNRGNKQHEQAGEDKSPRRIYLALTIFSTAFMFIFLNTVMQPRLTPYTLSPIDENELDATQPTNAKTPLEVTLPDFTKNPVSPESIVNTAVWPSFEDKFVGFEFKYPSDWGQPFIVLRRGRKSGWFYRLSFPNSSFSLSGASSNFSEGTSSGHAANFSGFPSLFGESSPRTKVGDLCEDTSLISCQSKNQNVLDIISGPSCGKSRFSAFQRITLLDRPGQLIRGLALGGSFLTSSYSSLLQVTCELTEGTQNDLKSNLGKAMVERRLDDKSLHRLDLIEKVIETFRDITTPSALIK